MNYIFILNPAAGKNRKALSMIPEIQKYCDRRGLEYRIHISKSGREITEFVRRTAADGGNYRFYAFGGDGTLNNVANGCIGMENCEVGVIPMGTGNDFIKNFSTDGKNFFDIEKQITSESVKIDAIKYNENYCINICNMGFDANTAMDMPAFKKLPMVSNKMAYNLAIGYNVVKKLGRYMEIYADDRLLFKGDTLMCAVSNGISCGGGFYVTPKADINDGLIDVSVVTPPNRIWLGMFVKHFTHGTQLDAPEMQKYIHFTRAEKVRVLARKPFAMVNDGEGEYFRDISFEIVRDALRFIVPV